MVDELQRLAEARALPGGERQRVVLAVVGELLFALPHLAADVDDLAGPPERRVVGHTVEALDHLWSRRADAEDEPAVRHEVEPGGRHCHERRRAGVDRQDARGDLHRGGLGGDVPIAETASKLYASAT
jgi:hypothetical protein